MNNTIVIPDTILNYDLTLAATRVYLALAEVRDENGESHLSAADLEDCTGLSNRSVRRGINELIALGLASKRALFRYDGGRATNAYRIYA